MPPFPLSSILPRAPGSSSSSGGGRGGSSSSSSSGGSRSGSSRTGSSSTSSYSSGSSGGGKKGSPNAWVKFGAHWVRRWQFGLIVTALVLAGIALLVVGFVVWKRRSGKKGMVVKGENRGWAGYVKGLRKKKAGEDDGGVVAKEMSEDSEDEERKRSRDGAGQRV